ncbi:RNA polymerase sigma-70 factor, ECF subfamily [Spirosomataceae bacterium TFI 002]|nr:RNA polymerase sigma-70 factor, ECF subfamily [Spirosomataceae bacterium TFI 002]
MFRITKNTTQSEEASLELYRKKGSLKVLGDLYAPYMEMVFGICLGYLKDRGKSEDAVMRIFEKLIIDLRKHEVGNLKSWLHSVARNFCLMELRKTQKEFIIDHEVFQVPIMDFDNEVHQESELQALENCTEALKKEQKEVINLFYKEQKSYAEICEVINLEMKKVKSLLQNARRMLKICIEKSV